MVMNFLRSSKFALLLTAVSVLILATLFFTTSPQSAKLFGILVVIIALYGVFLGVILLIGNLFTSRKRKKRIGDGASSRRGGNQRLEISAVLALAPVLAIVLNSLGAIGIVELVLIAGFEGIVIFLVRKKR
jgi:heme/copper-type cytochrome/quinol oxidase subunit 2